MGSTRKPTVGDRVLVLRPWTDDEWMEVTVKELLSAQFLYEDDHGNTNMQLYSGGWKEAYR